MATSLDLPSSAEQSLLWASFAADDTLIDCVLNFDVPQGLSLLSCANLGPLQAGIPTPLPLWLACMLQQKSLAKIVTPTWLSVDNLTEVRRHEQSETSLWPDVDRLPYDYFEVFHRLTLDDRNKDALTLLIQDIYDLRLDKLRRQWQQLMATSLEGELQVQVNGMTRHELAVLGSILRPTTTQRQAMMKRSKTVSADKEQPSGSALRGATTRRFRR